MPESFEHVVIDQLKWGKPQAANGKCNRQRDFTFSLQKMHMQPTWSLYSSHTCKETNNFHYCEAQFI